MQTIPHPKPKGRCAAKTVDEVFLTVRVPRDLDVAVEVAVACAGGETSKQQFAREALAEKLERGNPGL